MARRLRKKWLCGLAVFSACGGTPAPQADGGVSSLPLERDASASGPHGDGATGDGGPRVGPLAPGDVEGLPPGDAAGSEFTGSYLTDGSVRPAEPTCTCRTGQCADLPGPEVIPDGAWEVTQRDGVLKIQMRGGINTTCTGGIDADGAFWCGRSRGREPASEQLLIRGHALRDGGERVLEVETALTAQRAAGAGLADCDLASRGRLVASGSP